MPILLSVQITASVNSNLPQQTDKAQWTTGKGAPGKEKP